MILCIRHPCEQENPDTSDTCQACGKLLRIHNQFRPMNHIGDGGFSRSFRAIDEGNPSRPYCFIKQLLFQNTTLKQESIRLFQQEVIQLERMGTGTHFQVPALIWHGEEDGNYYIVEEYIDGKNLAQEAQEIGPFTEEKIWQVLQELLPLLQSLHQAKVIHWNIKPENIIRRQFDRRLVLVNFGSVKVAVTETKLAKTGTFISDPRYLPPEQLKGKPEFASDLYNLGVTCLYLITQVSPLQLYSDPQGKWVWRDYLPSGHQISPKLGQILDQLIAHPLGKRFFSAQDALTAMHSPIKAISILSRLIGSILISGVLAAFIVFGGLFIWYYSALALYKFFDANTSYLSVSWIWIWKHYKSIIKIFEIMWFLLAIGIFADLAKNNPFLQK